jgi:D-alanyl-D-alanine carboxypeptidase/D-alanyl-D-alanine-endopeptidase (penicillin-binding protein 4)
MDSLLLMELLQDTLKRSVHQIHRLKPADARVIFSVPSDSLYKVMMQESDNFIAEQLLILCAGELTDTLSTAVAIKKISERYLSDLSDRPAWVDGSGLSRYNLFTPRSIVQVWEKIYYLKPQDELFPLLAIGGKTGTLKNWFKADAPYVFGKTGSLSNNHCLSGFLVTKKGRILIFSFMNSNFIHPVKEVRQMMEDILKTIYEKM